MRVKTSGKYSRLRVLPFGARMAAKLRIDSGESIYGGYEIRESRSESHQKHEDPKDDKGNWKEIVIPEPVRKLDEAFNLLGLDIEKCTAKQAKKAYYKAAATAHPDKGGSEEDFRAVKEAYDLVVEHLKRNGSM